MRQICYLRIFLSTETGSYRLLQRMARMDMDLNLKTLHQIVQVLMLCL